MKLPQEQIDKIYKISHRITLGIIIVGLILLVVLPKSVIGSWFIFTWFGLFVATGIFADIIKRWATDEEELEFKKAVKEAMQEMEAEKKTRTKTVRETEIVECPLVDLNERQKQAVEDLLKRRIPKHAKDASRFDRAVVYNYLRALRSMHVLNPVRNSEDIDNFRKWMEQITGLYEPQEEWAHFRGDYEDFKRSNKKIQDAVKELTGEIEKFR